MQARFIWCGAGKNLSQHTAFSLPANWREYGPIIEWSFMTSTNKHSAEGSVTIPIHAQITPAGSTLSTYGTASINSGDHVFIQDLEAVINNSGSWPFTGWPIIQGTVDKVSYDNNLMTIHFRNPLSYLAENYVRNGITKASGQFISGGNFNGDPVSSIANPSTPIQPVTSTTARYIPNYAGYNEQRPGKIISDLVNYLASADVAGPFYRSTTDPTGALDGTFTPNWTTSNSKISLLNAILDICEGTKWSDGNGYGWEIQANPVVADTVTGNLGFSTELFLFRRGALNSGLIFDYHGAGTHNIISYSFPEQTYDAPTSGSANGIGLAVLATEDLASTMLTIGNSLLNAALQGAIARNGTSYQSSGRASSGLNTAITGRLGLGKKFLGDAKTVGNYRGLRVGSIYVGGWLNSPIFPGFLATVNIPEAGLINALLVMDEISYSEPDGITRISFNRVND